MHKPTTEQQRTNKHILPGERSANLLTGFERFMDRVFEAANLPLGPRLSSFGTPAVDAAVQFAPEIEMPLDAGETTVNLTRETPSSTAE